MPTRIVNFDAIVVNTIQVKINLPDGGGTKTYDLKDNFDLDIGLQAMQVMQQAADVSKSEDKTAQVAAILEINSAVTHVLGEIFRHSYPGVTDAEIASELAFNSRLELLKLFFTPIMSQFRSLQPATDSSTSPTVDQAAAETQQGESSRPAEIRSRSRSSKGLND